MTKRRILIKKLKAAFKSINGICKTEDLGYSKGGIHLGDCAEGGTIDDLPACDYYSEDYNEVIYVMGVHKKLQKLVEDHGWFVECCNPGVYHVWN